MSQIKPTLAFKSNLPSLFVLEIYHNDLNKIILEIKAKKKSSPMMFAGLQVLLDLSQCETESTNWDIVALKKTLLDESILPIAIMTDDKYLQQSAVKADIGFVLPILRTTLTTSPRREKTIKNKVIDLETSSNTDLSAASNNMSQSIANNSNAEPKKTDNNSTPSKVYLENQIINKTVRSGQRVYSKGDLIILGSVSAGAEVIADGNIHIYGVLNGRAMAGASNNVNACIFCRQMNAEIVSIAGHYWSFEDDESEYLNQSVKVSLENEKIIFESL